MGHPHRYVSQARHALREVLRDLESGSHVLVAASGGADSMALAATAVHEARRHAITVHSLTVDHGLREGSDAEAQQVVAVLCSMGIEARSVRVNVGEGAGPEGEARLARYSALAQESRRIWEECCSAAAGRPGHPERSVLVLLGHNVNDQAETVLMGLSRGSGARSLRGMPRAGSLPEYADVLMARPLLDMSHESLKTVCRELDIPWVEDPTNSPASEWRAADGSLLTRSGIRHEVMPVMEKIFGSSVVQALARTGTLVGQDDDALEWYARRVLREAREPALAAALGGAKTAPYACGEEACPPPSMSLSCAVLRESPQAVRSRVLRTAALAAGGRNGELFFSHIAALDKLVTGRSNNLRIDLPGAHAWKRNDYITFYPGQSPTVTS